MNLQTSVTIKSRLLCADCSELKSVSKVAFSESGDTVVKLKCGHTRGELLPLKPGRIGLEHLSTAQGRKLFPIVFEVRV